MRKMAVMLLVLCLAAGLALPACGKKEEETYGIAEKIPTEETEGTSGIAEPIPAEETEGTNGIAEPIPEAEAAPAAEEPQAAETPAGEPAAAEEAEGTGEAQAAEEAASEETAAEEKAAEEKPAEEAAAEEKAEEPEAEEKKEEAPAQEEKPAKTADDVEVTFTKEEASVVGFGSATQADADKLAAAAGLKSLTVNGDGSITALMSKKKQEELLGTLKKTIDKSVAAMVGSSQYPRFLGVHPTDDYLEYRILVNGDSLDPSESLCAPTLYAYGRAVGTLAGTRPSNIHIDFISGNTGIVLSSMDSGN